MVQASQSNIVTHELYVRGAAQRVQLPCPLLAGVCGCCGLHVFQQLLVQESVLSQLGPQQPGEQRLGVGHRGLMPQRRGLVAAALAGEALTATAAVAQRAASQQQGLPLRRVARQLHSRLTHAADEEEGAQDVGEPASAYQPLEVVHGQHAPVLQGHGAEECQHQHCPCQVAHHDHRHGNVELQHCRHLNDECDAVNLIS